jgi:tetrahydromethanopterin S-methyltransferase subunit G
MEQTPVPTAPLFNAFMHDLAKQLVPLIVAELKHQTNAEGMGMIALDPNNLSLPVYTLLSQDKATIEAINSIIDDRVDDTFSDLSRRLDRVESDTTANVDISDNDDFNDLQSRVSTLEEKVGELEENRGTEVDADDSDFQDAVRSVIRNHI